MFSQLEQIIFGNEEVQKFLEEEEKKELEKLPNLTPEQIEEMREKHYRENFSFLKIFVEKNNLKELTPIQINEYLAREIKNIFPVEKTPYQREMEEKLKREDYAILNNLNGI